MNRQDLFARLRPIMPDKSFTPQAVAVVDGIADDLGMAREGDPGLSEALALIKSFEGCELSAYPDPGTGGDPWTIGFGHTGPEVKKGLTWSQAQADSALADDVAKFSNGVRDLTKGYPTSSNEYAALVSFAYNVGLGALADSTLLKKHRAGDKKGAAAEFARWTKACGRELKGLVRRRAAEAAVYRGQA